MLQQTSNTPPELTRFERQLLHEIRRMEKQKKPSTLIIVSNLGLVRVFGNQVLITTNKAGVDIPED